MRRTGWNNIYQLQGVSNWKGIAPVAVKRQVISNLLERPFEHGRIGILASVGRTGEKKKKRNNSHCSF